MYVPTYFWHNFKFKTIWMSNKDFTQIDFTKFSSLFTRVTLKRFLTGISQCQLNFQITMSTLCTLEKMEKKTLFTDFTFFSQRVPLWATTESKLSKTILGCFFGGAHWPNGRRKRGADARWVLRNTGRKVVKTIWHKFIEAMTTHPSYSWNNKSQKCKGIGLKGFIFEKINKN